LRSRPRRHLRPEDEKALTPFDTGEPTTPDPGDPEQVRLGRLVAPNGVWLTREAVAQGVDSVVEAAMQWIHGLSGAGPTPSLARVDRLTNSPNPFGAQTTIAGTVRR
jgi:hypothetical protein